jgi:hypothetical protein
MGGQITLHSEEFVGSTFSFSIPLPEVPANMASAETSVARNDATGAETPAKTID